LTASSNLVGQSINDRWDITKLIVPGPLATGGHFSNQYVAVERKTGREAFVKAFDLESALNTANFTEALQKLTEQYHFERDVLQKCRGERLSRVAVPLDIGEVSVNSRIGRVPVIVFELAESDIRKVVVTSGTQQVRWIYKVLHHTATGLSQLHSHQIAHQDLKPSNVLVYADAEHQICDLGRSSAVDLRTEVDAFSVPGDRNYAPFDMEFHDGTMHSFDRRRELDLYLLGSLIFFLFTGNSTRSLIVQHIRQRSLSTGKTWESTLPSIRSAFADALFDLRIAVEKVDAKYADEVCAIARELCEPDPKLRGNSVSKPTSVSRLSLARYISRFNALFAAAPK